MQGVLQMSGKERERLRVVEAVKERRLTQTQAAVRLSLSVRQVKRLCRAYRRRGAAGLISRKRGRDLHLRSVAAFEVLRLVSASRVSSVVSC